MKNNNGFTLIEFLIVLAISGIILGSIFQLFTSSQEAYVVQDEVASMQQNVRVAKMFLERDLRMAGSGVMNMSGPNNSIVYPLEFHNADGATGSDKIVVMYEDQSGSGCGTAPTGVNLCSDLPPLTLASTMPTTSTTAEVTQEFSTAPYDMWQQTCYCNGTTYTATTYDMPFIVISPDYSESAILIATKTSNNGGGSLDNLANGPNTMPEEPNQDFYDLLGVPDNTSLDNKLLNSFDAGSTIKFFNANAIYKATYYIDDNNGIPCLFRDTPGNNRQLIAEYIEDLQANFGLDTNGDGSVDTWINNVDLTDAQKMQVRLATLSVLARTSHEHRNFTGGRPVLEDHAAGADDRFRRRLQTFTVKVRNFGLD